MKEETIDCFKKEFYFVEDDSYEDEDLRKIEMVKQEERPAIGRGEPTRKVFHKALKIRAIEKAELMRTMRQK